MFYQFIISINKLRKNRLFLASIAFSGLVFAIMVISSNVIINAYEKYAFDSLEELPFVQTCLLLGTSKNLKDGRINQYFLFRINAAVELYKSGKCKKIIVSGDNRSHSYNEPLDMKNSLIEKGVSENDIICDFAGLRTLDSVVRYKEIFGQEKGIVISQKFHNLRALYIGRFNGIELYGYNAKNVNKFGGIKTKLREIFSRIKCIFDLNVFHTKPKYLGEKIKI